MKKILLVLLSLFSLQTHANPEICNEHYLNSLQEHVSKDILKDYLKLKALHSNNPKFAEQKIIESLWQLESKGKLDNAIEELVRLVKESNKVASLKNAPDEMISGMLKMAIKSEFFDRGFYNPNFKFVGWDKISKAQQKKLKALPSVSSFEDKEFKKVFHSLSGEQMTSLRKMQVLASNSVAFEKRLEIIGNAKKSIKLMTWGYHDDEIGIEMTKALIAAKTKNRELRVQIIVDHLVAQRPGYKEQIKVMREHGIEIIEWTSKENPFAGMHSKMLIVDDKYSIDGGRNIGNYYLMDDKWSDLDVYMEGDIAEVTNPNIFAKMWNQQINDHHLALEKIELKDASNLHNGTVGTFISHPQHQTSDSISDLTIYAIMNATKEIEITNAYFILTEGMEKALADAIARKVKVRIVSNSMKSVDEPIVSIPIQKSLKKMFDMGAEIYVKEGETLHTKMFRADGLTWYGSYNLHPRSARFEVEKITVSTNRTLNDSLSEAQEDIIKQSTKINFSDELNSPESDELDLLFSLIFNQL